MSYCLNPNCSKPQNPNGVQLCQGCGTPLLLQQRYQALKLIGQGGFGRTFLAVDGGKPSTPRCVIKQFFPVGTGLVSVQGTNHAQKAAELFRQEARRLKELGKHPQIPALLAHIEQDGQQYLVQEFIAGQNLAQELAEAGTFNEAQIWELLTSLLPVLKFIHERQVIHRDIKPANIIRRTAPALPTPRKTTTALPSKNQLVLVDFGAAKFTTGAALAQTGTTIGSAEYTAPEQIRGKAVFASDLYSLGVTCIHLLTQIPPFDLFDSSEDTWIWRDYLTHPVSDTLGRVLDKLLQSATKRRYQSVAEVLKDLKFQPTSRLIENIPIPRPSVQSKPPSSPAHSAESASASHSQTPSWLETNTLEDIPEKAWSIFPFAVPSEAAIEPTAHQPPLPVTETPQKLRQEAALRVGLATFMIFMTSSVIRLAANNWRATSDFRQTDDSLILPNPSDENPEPEYSQTTLPLRTLSESDLRLSLAISPDGQTLVTGSATGREEPSSLAIGKSHRKKRSQASSIKVWDVPTGRLLYTLPTRYPVWSVAISPDGKTLVSSTTNVSSDTQQSPRDNSSDRGNLQIWSLRTGNLLHTIPKSPDDGMYIAISPDGKMLASGANEAIKLWNLQTGELLHTLEPQSSGVNSIVFSPDGQLLASTGFDGKIKIWNLPTGELMRTLEGQSGSIGSLAISANGQTLVSGVTNGGFGSISTWNLRTGELMSKFNPPDAIVSVAISPDGKTLASGSWDYREGTIRVWNLETRQLLHTIRAHRSVVDSLTFSLDGKTLASGSLDQTIKIWQVSP